MWPQNFPRRQLVRGAFGEMQMARTLSAFQKSLKASGNLRSRSRIKKRGSIPLSASRFEALRACCMTHALSGCLVGRLQLTLREPKWMKHKRYAAKRPNNVQIGLVKKSVATIESMCAGTKVDQAIGGLGPLLLGEG